MSTEAINFDAGWTDPPTEARWSQETFGSDWATARLHGTVLALIVAGREHALPPEGAGPEAPRRWKVLWDDGDMGPAKESLLRLEVPAGAAARSRPVARYAAAAPATAPAGCALSRGESLAAAAACKPFCRVAAARRTLPFLPPPHPLAESQPPPLFEGLQAGPSALRVLSSRGSKNPIQAMTPEPLFPGDVFFVAAAASQERRAAAVEEGLRRDALWMLFNGGRHPQYYDLLVPFLLGAGNPAWEEDKPGFGLRSRSVEEGGRPVRL